MTGYIEREAFLDAIERGKKYQQDVDDIAEMLQNFPTADVREVVRGKWSIHEIYKHEMSYGVMGYEPVYKCSVCGRLMESYLRFDEPIMPEDASFPRFCPNCGADMREES